MAAQSFVELFIEKNLQQLSPCRAVVNFSTHLQWSSYFRQANHFINYRFHLKGSEQQRAQSRAQARDCENPRWISRYRAKTPDTLRATQAFTRQWERARHVRYQDSTQSNKAPQKCLLQEAIQQKTPPDSSTHQAYRDSLDAGITSLSFGAWACSRSNA